MVAKKSIICLLTAVFLWGMDRDAVELIQEYRQNGVVGLEKKVQNYLQDKTYWMEVLKNMDTKLGYYESTEYVFLSDKSLPNLILYKMENNKPTEVGSSSALVGSGKGDKKLSGDLTTPIGVYKIEEKLTKLHQYYGALAYTTSYPNTLDRSLKRTGHGIWIHGMPLDGNRDELNTKGCIAIENNLLSSYDRKINYKNAILISYEKVFTPANNEDLSIVLSTLFNWKDAWMRNQFDKYISFYGSDFTKEDGMKFNKFKNYKSRIFQKNEQKKIRISKINVSPYPNEENKKIYVISFMQEYRAFKNNKQTYESNSLKELYVVVDQGKAKIISEK